MKALFASLLIISSASFAADLGLQIAGTYSKPHAVMLGGYNSPKDCQKDGGTWQGHSKCLIVGGGDSVTLTATATPDQYKLDIETVGSNEDQCRFVATATLLNPVQLTAQQPGTDFVFDPTTQHFGPVPGTCQVTVEFQDEKTLSIDSSSACQSLCGAGVNLNVQGATKK